jgi:hypothetical protein
MSRIARAAVLMLVAAGALVSPGCAEPPWRSHPWRPPGTRPPIHTWTTTYGEFPPSIDRPHVMQGQPSDG